jgi:mannose/fructose/N-acetylgalactosamine-specific phosphotransferase system component IIC
MQTPLPIAIQRAKLALLSALVCVCLAACASAPVQEMSDARQAIRAAQDAGAATAAAKPLADAQTALSRAESLLNKRFFRAARRNAEEAHSKAVEALQYVRAVKPVQ